MSFPAIGLEDTARLFAIAGVLASLKMDNLLTKAQVANLDEQALRNALALGAKAAAVTVSRAGANPPWAKEIGL